MYEKKKHDNPPYGNEFKVLIVGDLNDVERITPDMPGVEGVEMQWLLKDDMPHFQMRRFVMGPNGKVPLHTHRWEHQVFCLSGKGKILFMDEEHDVGPGSFAYIDGSNPHGFENAGTEDFVFICCVGGGTRLDLTDRPFSMPDGYFDDDDEDDGC